MKRDELIRRGDVLALAEEFEDINPETGESIVYRAVETDAVASIPAVDAVEVVRCRECIYRVKRTAECTNNGGVWGDDEYCSDGQRREEDGDGNADSM